MQRNEEKKVDASTSEIAEYRIENLSEIRISPIWRDEVQSFARFFNQRLRDYPGKCSKKNIIDLRNRTISFIDRYEFSSSESIEPRGGRNDYDDLCRDENDLKIFQNNFSLNMLGSYEVKIRSTEEKKHFINGTQKNIVDATFSFLFSELHEISADKAIMVLEVFLRETISPGEIDELKKQSLWLEYIESYRAIIDHKCPENRAESYSYVGQEDGFSMYKLEREKIKSFNADGDAILHNSKVIPKSNIIRNNATLDDFIIAKEPTGLLSLTSRDNNIDPPVNKKVVIDYINELIKQEISKHKSRLLAEEKIASKVSFYDVELRIKNTQLFQNSRTGSKEPSRIQAISFEKGFMKIFVNSYLMLDDITKVYQTTYHIDVPQEMPIILAMISGKISARKAFNLVGGVLDACKNEDNAKWFCHQAPGIDSYMKYVPIRVIDEKSEATLEKFLKDHSILFEESVQKSIVSPFDFVRNIIINGESKLDISTRTAEHHYYIIKSILRALRNDTEDENIYFRIIIEQCYIRYFLKIYDENFIMLERINSLQNKITQGWMKRGDSFIKHFSSGPERDCFLFFSKLAQLDSYEDNYFGFFRITGGVDFLKLQSALLGKEINVIPEGLISSASESKHHKEDFKLAVLQGKTDIVLKYLEDGLDPHHGILLAAQAGNQSIAELLFKAGADYKCKNSIFSYSYPTMLHTAALYDQFEFAKYLIKAKPLIVDEFAYGHATALHYLCDFGASDNPEFVELLVKSGANINIRDYDGRTPLHMVISNGKEGSIKKLLELGARVDIKYNERTVFDYAIEYGSGNSSPILRKGILGIMLEHAISKGLKTEEMRLREQYDKISDMSHSEQKSSSESHRFRPT